jgi:hypothetical protein
MRWRRQRVSDTATAPVESKSLTAYATHSWIWYGFILLIAGANNGENRASCVRAARGGGDLQECVA